MFQDFHHVTVRTSADNMEESVFIIRRPRGNTGRPSSSLAVTEAGGRLIAWSHLSYWLFWMKYGLIGCRPLTLANIDFHSLFRLSVPLCYRLPLIFSTLTSSLSLTHPLSPTFFLYSSLNLQRNDHQGRNRSGTKRRATWGDVFAGARLTKGGQKETSRGEDRAWRGGMEWKTKRKWKRDSGVEGETDGGAEMKWKRDRAGNRGREGGVIIYQVFGCAWQRRKLISTLCVHQLHSQASQGIPLACLCEAGGDAQTLSLYESHIDTV